MRVIGIKVDPSVVGQLRHQLARSALRRRRGKTVRDATVRAKAFGMRT